MWHIKCLWHIRGEYTNKCRIYRVPVERSEGKRHIRPRRRWQGTIKMSIKEIG